MENEKIILAAASIYTEKYFVSPDFEKIPKSVLDEIKNICIQLSARLHCVFCIGFYKDGKVYFETITEDGDDKFSDTLAEEEISKLRTDEQELIKGLETWYKIFILKEVPHV